MSQSVYKSAVVTNGGTIEGRVIFAGSVTKDEDFAVTKDDRVCGKSLPAQTLLVGNNHGVQNAVVYLEEIAAGKAWPASKLPVLDQRGCVYNPHVLIIPASASLQIVNSDPVLHNVHLYTLSSIDQTVCNIAQPVKGQRTNFDQLGSLQCRFLHATCDAGHPWMSAYIVRADNPYYVLTNEKGEFRLTDIPPGNYTLTMWHEGIRVVKTLTENGKVSKYYFEDPYSISNEIVISPKSTAHVDFQLSLRSRTGSVAGTE